MSWKLAPAAYSGSLLEYVDEISVAEVVAKFGKPSPDAYYEPEKGYDGFEWQFVDENGRYINLYSRYGQFRLGGVAPIAAVEFKAWLLKELGRD